MRFGLFTRKQLSDAARATQNGQHNLVFPVCGGLARAVKMTPAERSASALHAITTRWANVRAKQAKLTAKELAKKERGEPAL